METGDAVQMALKSEIQFCDLRSLPGGGITLAKCKMRTVTHSVPCPLDQDEKLVEVHQESLVGFEEEYSL